MTRSRVLVLPNFSKPFIAQTDASGKGMDAVLQEKSHPVSYYNKKLWSKLQNYSTYLKELHAIASAIQKWKTTY